MKNTQDRARIMIVDDEPENLRLLHEMLGEIDCEVHAFPRGDLAVQAALKTPPDLVLMDICMPDMNGFDTCRLLKRHPRLHPVPVIFLSGLTALKDKTDAFDAGGIDYITKPFFEQEVLARVRTHLALHRHREHLEDLLDERTRALREAHRRLTIWDDAKSDWLNVLSHEMRTPMTGIIGAAELLFLEAPAGPQLDELRLVYNKSVQRIQKLMDDALALIQIDVTGEEFAQEESHLDRLLQEAILGFESTETMAVTVLFKPSEPTSLRTDPRLLGRALGNLLHAAACCTDGTQPLRVDRLIEPEGFRVRIIVPEITLPEEALVSFFDLGGQRIQIRGGGDFGLAPVLAARILDLLGGSCTVSNRMGEQQLEIGVSIPR